MSISKRGRRVGVAKKGYALVPPLVARRIGRLSKIGALELAYSLAGRLAESADNPYLVYDVLLREWETVASYRGDRPLLPLDLETP